MRAVLQTLHLSVSLCYRCKKLRHSKKWQEWKLKGVNELLTLKEGRIKMLEEISSQSEQSYTTHLESMKESVRRRQETFELYCHEVKAKTRRCQEVHQKALEERCHTAKQQVQVEVDNCAKLQACCAELETQVAEVRRPVQTCVPSHPLLLLFTDLVQTWVKGMLHVLCYIALPCHPTPPPLFAPLLAPLPPVGPSANSLCTV